MDTGHRVRGLRCEKGKHSPRVKTRKTVGKVLTPLARADPEKLPDVDLRIRIRNNWFLDDKILRHKSKKGYVRGQVESIRWEESRD
jgi:hypothetical protein